MDGLHHFKEDPSYGELLRRFRDGTITIEDIEILNGKLYVRKEALPDGIQYAVYTNRERDRINTAVFEKHCEETADVNQTVKDAVMIFSDDIQLQTAKRVYSPLKNRHFFWNNCGESDINCGRMEGRMDPVLKLFRGGAVMLPTNDSVEFGRANGTCAEVLKVVLKPGEQVKYLKVQNGTRVPAVLAGQVDRVVLHHSNDEITPRKFEMKPKDITFDADLPLADELRVGRKRETEKIKMKALQVPIISNCATTGHKLQGKMVEHLLVGKWHYGTNWPYVVLSRVKTQWSFCCWKS